MQIKTLFVAGALALAFVGVHAADPTDTKADAQRLKKLNLCNKQAKGKSDADYQKAMEECMKKAG
ncbi:MAG: hypothetical protein EOP02_16845 [Proteobacteria bacterium]|nr:MAG: hypothetical protein EOP02_16845 [Pseudomonadota bacterium]